MRWTVGHKISLGYLIAMILLITISLPAYLNLTYLLEAKQLADRTLAVISRIDDLESLIKDAETGQRGFLLTGDTSYLAPYLQAAQKIDGALLKFLAIERNNAVPPQRLELLRQAIGSKLAELQETVAIRQKNGLQPALAIVLTNRGKRDMDTIRSVISALKADEVMRSQALSAAVQLSIQTTRQIMLFGLPFAVLVMFLAAWLITRNIAHPLQELATAARRIAVGDLSVSLNIGPRQDELGILCHVFAEMVASLRGKASTAAAISRGELNIQPSLLSSEDELGLAFVAMVENLKGTVANLRSGSMIMSEVASTVSLVTEQVVGTADETASATLQLSTTVDELRQTTEITSKRMEDVSYRSAMSTEAAQQGKAAVHDASASMYEVQSCMAVLADRTAKLTERSLSIGEIASAVNHLAEQSAILSVNASLEAAHANEHGLGFAAVAAEIRSLASQSKQAVQTVRTILAEMQRLIAGLVDAAEQSNLAITRGVNRSEAASVALTRIAEVVESNTGTAKEVAVHAMQQATGIAQIAVTIHQIKVAASDNLLNMRNIKLATGELERASLGLRGQIAAFKT
ncbi:methyl-accepting chemotaxis protein [Chitinimonas sp. BJB300]|uniref:methyl-accepting chemotaxis protein n=1 Tax=Chitinimonas sp. BJB300 TaxID=1559339 RepID=UPI000C10A8AC|nr:CHASE3 domain-containing protein [Chitinimonas sp. BJB300]PHV13026.1 hypothetical protein CSQ89_02865 [Chitinimonas sp. BJB300]TSJ88915.1 methyl-accepting chemotaxis protein [Chitinimonas sp. BJB300]